MSVPRVISTCPPEELLERYCARACPEEEASSVEAHVQNCPRCRSWIVEARADDDLLGQLRGAVDDGAVKWDRGSSASTFRSAQRTAQFVPATPDSIAGYRILRVLGTGGMGIVYEAQQERPRRRVALKLVRPGAATASALHRFEHEAHVLARLQHPGIAQIYEVGTERAESGDQPFFAMELVEGRDLASYAAENRLDLRRRLEMLERICDAVQHAHDKGVIHRDLKPANILVTPAGHPKILDFGVARVTEADVAITTIQTNPGVLVGTLRYMSPEQCGVDPGEIDVRTDVYSLGVIGYELLSGQPPYLISGRMIAEACRTICEEEPKSLGSLDRALRGDLEIIFAKALEKSRARRYQSAAEFAADIRRYLSQQPISAKPPSLGYQARKLIERHRGVAIMVGLLIVALLLFGIVTSVLLFRARTGETRALDAEREARNQAEAATRVAASLMELLGTLDPLATNSSGSLAGAGQLPEEILERAAATIHGKLDDQPETRLKLLDRLVIININRGRFEKAEALARESLAVARQNFGDEHALVARAMVAIGYVLVVRHRLGDAEPWLSDGLSMQRRILGDEHPEVVRGLYYYSVLSRELGDVDAAEEMLREAMAIAERAGSPEDLPAAHHWNQLGLVMAGKRDYEEARSAYEKAIALFAGYEGEWQDIILDTRMSVALAWRDEGNIVRAIELMREIEAEQRERYSTGHPRLALTLQNLADAFRVQRNFEKAEAYIHEALKIYDNSLTSEHPLVSDALQLSRSLMMDRGDLAAAEELAREDLSLARRVWDSDSKAVVNRIIALVEVLIQRKTVDEARALLREALESCRRALSVDPNRSHQLIGLYKQLYLLEHQEGDTIAASECFKSLIEIVNALYGEQSRHVADHLRELALSMEKKGDYATAETHYRDALAIYEATTGPESLPAAEARRVLAAVLMVSDRPAEAAALLGRAYGTLRDLLGPSHQNTHGVMFHAIRALIAADQSEEAGLLIAEMFTIQQEELREDRYSISKLHTTVEVLGLLGDTERLDSLVEPFTAICERTASLSDDHPDRSGAPLLLGLTYHHLGDQKAAEPLLRQAVELRELHLPANEQWMTGYARGVLGECLARQGNFAAAESLFLDAWESMRAMRGEIFHRTGEAARCLIALYEAWGKPELAEAFQARRSLPPR